MKHEQDPARPFWLMLDWELIGEGILLLMATTLMVTMLVQSFHWRPGSALMPRLATSAGLLFVVVRVYALARGAGKKQGGRIMDIGFTGAEDTKLALRRFAQSAGSVVVLVLAILSVGWHVALPLWVAGYMLIFAKQKWYWAIAAGLAFEAVIVLIYDRIFATVWNDPWLFQIFDKFVS